MIASKAKKNALGCHLYYTALAKATLSKADQDLRARSALGNGQKK